MRPLERPLSPTTVEHQFERAHRFCNSCLLCTLSSALFDTTNAIERAPGGGDWHSARTDRSGERMGVSSPSPALTHSGFPSR